MSLHLNPDDPLQNKTLRRKLRIDNLNKAIDNKLDINTAIYRRGTPMHNLLGTELPSPVAGTQGSTLPHQFTFKTLKPKLKPSDPDEYDEKPCFQGTINEIN